MASDPNLKVEVTLVADCLVDRVKRKKGEKVLVPAALAKAFGEGTTFTPETRAKAVAAQQAGESGQSGQSGKSDASKTPETAKTS